VVFVDGNPLINMDEPARLDPWQTGDSPIRIGATRAHFEVSEFKLIPHVPEAAPTQTTNVAQESVTDDGWADLYNRRDLTGWREFVASNAWTVHEGVLVAEPGRERGWLATEQEYSDFELQLEYKLAKYANSGIFLRIPDANQPLDRQFIEVQLIDDDNQPGIQSWQRTGAVYAVAGPTKNPPTKWGEWQRLTIRAQGPELTVWINDEEVNKCNLATVVPQHPPVRNLNRTTGRIGLQRYGSQVEFRNLRIRELDATGQVGRPTADIPPTLPTATAVAAPASVLPQQSLEHTKPVYAVAFSPDGRWLATGGSDGVVRLWNVAADQKPRLVQTWVFGASVNQVAFSADSSIVASCGEANRDSQQRVRFWRTNGEELTRASAPGSLYGPVAFHPKKDQFLATNSKHELVVCDLDPSKAPLVIGSSPQRIMSIAVSSDGATCATGHDKMLVQLWGLSGNTRQKQWALPVDEKRTCKHVHAILFHPGSSSMFVANSSNLTRIDLTTLNERWTYQAHATRSLDVQLSPDGAWLVSCGGTADAAHFAITNLVSGTKKNEIQAPGVKGANALAFHPHYQWLATAGPDNRVRLWNVGSWTEHKPEDPPPIRWR
jgi:hypothetical protein